MSATTLLRELRTKYNIPLRAISQKVGVSNQYLSCVELGTVHAGQSLEKKIQCAVRELIAESREVLSEMECDFLQSEGRLLQKTEEKHG